MSHFCISECDTKSKTNSQFQKYLHMKSLYTTGHWEVELFHNGQRSEENKLQEMTPPVPENEIPCESQSNHCEFSWRVLVIVAISLILTLASAYWGLFYEGLTYTSSTNNIPIMGALICMYAINFMMCFNSRILRRSSSNNILMALYAAGLLCTRPFCIPSLFNIQKAIDGQYDMGEYTMGALCLGQDALVLSLFIISMCIHIEGGGSGDEDDSSSGDSGGDSGDGGDSGGS
ncbi:uncharacterized protein LOC108025199 [Drosophila biarmipes]|uniref:uncharacterized protein LOC108025199 n=1 Tax=Drosophila biarmipes TaxID=125945 RepID=UPI0007E72444|nr:uncharacterized protein LOC108025199 [Drosophila biarmipes]